MAKDCVNHTGAPVAVHCFQCSKPVCTACVHVMPYGRFCSVECGLLYKDWQARSKEGKVKRPGALMSIVGVLVILTALVGGLYGYHLAVRNSDSETLKKFDIIGRLISIREKQLR